MTVGYFHYSNCTTSIKVPSGALQKKSLTFLSLDKVGSDKYFILFFFRFLKNLSILLIVIAKWEHPIRSIL